MILDEDCNDFSDIHRLINEEKQKAMGDYNDETLEKSISAMVEFKC